MNLSLFLVRLLRRFLLRENRVPVFLIRRGDRFLAFAAAIVGRRRRGRLAVRGLRSVFSRGTFDLRGGVALWRLVGFRCRAGLRRRSSVLEAVSVFGAVSALVFLSSLAIIIPHASKLSRSSGSPALASRATALISASLTLRVARRHIGGIDDHLADRPERKPGELQMRPRERNADNRHGKERWR